MDVEYVKEICKRHSDCKECPFSDVLDDDKIVCVFTGTPDTWDPYNQKKNIREDK